MESIRDKVAIVGMGCTKFGERWDASADDMIVEAALEAYEDAGIKQEDIQAAWVGTMWVGDTGRVLAEPLKLQFIPVTRVENMCATGSDAMRNAAYAVAAGVYDIVLALGVEKLKDTGWMGLGDVPYDLGEEPSQRCQTPQGTSAPRGNLRTGDERAHNRLASGAVRLLWCYRWGGGSNFGSRRNSQEIQA